MPDQHFPQSVSVCRDCGEIAPPEVSGGKCQVLPGIFKDHDRVVVEIALVEFIRKQRDEELRERLFTAVAENTAAPSGLVLSDDYDRGRTEERSTWISALDAIFEDPTQ